MTAHENNITYKSTIPRERLYPSLIHVNYDENNALFYLQLSNNKSKKVEQSDQGVLKMHILIHYIKSFYFNFISKVINTRGGGVVSLGIGPMSLIF